METALEFLPMRVEDCSKEADKMEVYCTGTGNGE
jgi:hypothetical protein